MRAKYDSKSTENDWIARLLNISSMPISNPVKQKHCLRLVDS